MRKKTNNFVSQTYLSFDKKQTNIAKGIAILLLLGHHLFLNNEGYISFINLNGMSLAGISSTLGKVCVAMFLFLSGYGLYKSFSKFKQTDNYFNHPIKSQFRYVIKHLIKLLSDFWLVFIIFVPLGLFFGRSFIDVYHGNPLYFILDFLGLSYLPFKGEATMNATWWFMSIIIVYYIIFPVLYKIQEYSNELLLCIGIAVLLLPLPNIRELNTYFFPFVFGMYISKVDGLVTLGKKLGSTVNQIICCVLALTAFACFRFVVFGTNDGLFAFSIILFSFLILSRIPILNKVLEELGKYSGLIFMFHTFIFSLYFKDFVYWFRYPPIIFIVFSVLCYFIAIGLEYLKRLVRYERLMMKVLK